MSQGRLPILISRSENQHSARSNRVDERTFHRAIQFDRHRTAIRIEQVDAACGCIRSRVDQRYLGCPTTAVNELREHHRPCAAYIARPWRISYSTGV